MFVKVGVVRGLLLVGAGLLSGFACSSSDAPVSGESQAKVIGPEGGTLIGPGGVTLIVPVSALSAAKRLSITRRQDGYPALPSGDLVSSVFAFEPDGQEFAKSVTIRIPFTYGNDRVQVITAKPDGAWSIVSGGSAQDGVAQVQADHFSFYGVVTVVQNSETPGGGGGAGIDGSAGESGDSSSAGSDGASAEAAGATSAGAGNGGASPGSAGSSGASPGSAGSSGASPGSAGSSGGHGGASAGNAGSGGSGGGSGGASAGSGGSGGGSGGASAGTGSGGSAVCVGPVANAPTGTSGLASYPKGMAQIHHYAIGNLFETTLSLEFSTVDQCGYVMSGTYKDVLGPSKFLYLRSTIAAPSVTAGTYQPIAYDDATSSGFREGEVGCEAGWTDGEVGTTLVVTSITNTRVAGLVKRGALTTQQFDLPICTSDAPYCGCAP